MRWLLPISLALNAFFIVIAVRHQPFLHPEPPNPGHFAHVFGAGLSPADAAIWQRSFADHAPAMNDMHREGREFPDQIRAALAADPFDPDALKAALDKGRTARQRADDAMAGALVEAATKMSAEGRAKLAAAGGPFGPPPDHRHGPDFPPPPPPPPGGWSPPPPPPQ